MVSAEKLHSSRKRHPAATNLAPVTESVYYFRSLENSDCQFDRKGRFMVSRRLFLQSTIAGGIASSVVASELTQRPSLGFSLYGMKSLLIPEALHACAEIGYTHVEFCLNSGFPTEPAVFSAESRQLAVQQLRQLSLQLPCLMIHLSLTTDEVAHAAALQTIQTAAMLAHELVPEQPPMLETVLGGSPAKWDEQKELMVRRLEGWAKAAEESRVNVALKAHVGSAVNSPERLLWLLNAVPSPALCAAFDYSHFELQGLDLKDSLEQLLPHTRFVHVKDSVGTPQKFQFLLPGEGRTDYLAYFSLLKHFGYNGPVCVEVSGQVSGKPDYDPLAAARKCYAVLSDALERAWTAR